MLHLLNINKSYPLADNQEYPVLRDVNLQLLDGAYVSIMGSSGSGKSTLMNILGCLDLPNSGEYYLDEQRVNTLNQQELATIRNQHIGFVFQGFNLLARRTIRDNVGLPLIYSDVDAKIRSQRADEMLARVGLEGYGDRYSNQLSGGQQQRVAIARALINQPQLILADEPTGNLDSKTSLAVMELFTTLNREMGVTIVLVTHESDIAAHTQQVIRIQDGQVMYE